MAVFRLFPKILLLSGVVTNSIYYPRDLGDSEWRDGFLILNNPLKDPPIGVEKKVMVKHLSTPVLEEIPWNHPNLVLVKDFSWSKGLCAIEYVRTDFHEYFRDHPRSFFCENVVNRPFKENIRQMIKSTDHLHKMGRVFTDLSIRSVFYAPDPSGSGIKIQLNHLACVVPHKNGTKELKLNDWRDLAILIEHVQKHCRACDPELQEICNFLKYNKDIRDMESRVLGHMFFWKEKRRDFLDRFDWLCLGKSKFVADLEKFKVDIVPAPDWTMVVDADLLAHLNSKLTQPNACYDVKSVVDWIHFCRRTTMHFYTIPKHVKTTLGIWNRNQALFYFKSLQPKMLLTMKKIVDKAHLKDFWSLKMHGNHFGL